MNGRFKFVVWTLVILVVGAAIPSQPLAGSRRSESGSDIQLVCFLKHLLGEPWK
jgi:hypothetical protein